MKRIPRSAVLLFCAVSLEAQTEFKYKIARVFNDLGRVEALALCSGDKTAYAGSSDGSIYFIDIEGGATRRVASGKYGIEAADCSRDNSMAAGGSTDGTIWLTRGSNTAQPIGAKNGHKGKIFSLKFSPRGEFLVSSGHDKNIFVWDPGSGQKLF